MEQDISDYVEGQAPMTEEKREMQIYGMKPIELFAEELLDGNIIYNRGEWNWDTGKSEPVYFNPGEEYEYTMDKLWGKYNEFLESKAAGDRIDRRSKKSFGKEIRTLVKIENINQHRHGGTPIILTISRV
jgi:hypothetical protein